MPKADGTDLCFNQIFWRTVTHMTRFFFGIWPSHSKMLTKCFMIYHLPPLYQHSPLRVQCQLTKRKNCFLKRTKLFFQHETKISWIIKHATVHNLKTDDGIMLNCKQRRRRKPRRRSTEDECGPNWSLMKAAFTKAENPQRTKQRFRSPVLTYQGDAICMAIQNCRRFRCQSALVDCPPPCLTALTLLAL